MSKWFRVAARFFAALLFIWGAMSLPFGLGASQAQGSKPILGWFIFLGSVLIPWVIGFWLVRVSMKADKD